VPHHYQGYSWQRERDEQTNERSRKEKREREKQKWGRRRKESDTLSFLLFSFILFFFSSLLSSSIQHSLTTYNSDPMDGLREIHFGERSLSLSPLYKNDSRRCIPLLLVVVLLVVFVVAVPCCCWLCGDVDDTLWWELRPPRGDDEPSTSKLK